MTEHYITTPGLAAGGIAITKTTLSVHRATASCRVHLAYRSLDLWNAYGRKISERARRTAWCRNGCSDGGFGSESQSVPQRDPSLVARAISSLMVDARSAGGRHYLQERLYNEVKTCSLASPHITTTTTITTMCWQGFVRFLCGHTQLIEEECEHARELDLAFWLKVDCPYYRICHRAPEFECGAGRFYCAETHDGRYLDMVVKQKAISEERLAQLDRIIATKLDPWERTTVQQLKAQYSNHLVALQAYRVHPHIIKITSLRRDVESERNSVGAKINDADNTLYYSNQFMKLNAGTRPALPGYLRQFGKTPARFMPPRPQRPPHHRWLGATYHSASSNIASAPRVLQEKTNLQGTMKPRAVTKQAPPVETAPVRRSMRGKKQVNYAEDDVDSTESSPERASPVAPPSSLKDIILEQRQRTAARLQALNRAQGHNSPLDRFATPEERLPTTRSASPQGPPTYDAMRESFAKQVNLKPTNLTPPIRSNFTLPSAQHSGSPAVTGSPLKRKVSSSPALPSKKRLHFENRRPATAAPDMPRVWEQPQNDALPPFGAPATRLDENYKWDLLR